MKKSPYLLLPLLFIFVISAVVVPLHKVYADITADVQSSASDAQQAQAQAASVAKLVTATQQCVSQNNTSCAQTQVSAAVTDADAAQTDAAAALLLATNDTSNSTGSNQAAAATIKANASQAEAAASQAESSASQAATAAGETSVAQKEALAATQSGASANSSLTAAQVTSGAPVTTAGASPGGSNFALLTNFPAFTSNSFNINAINFSVFFNNLYKICIGVAAVLALLQIIRAGFTYMTAGDNTERVSQARGLIASSVFGLVLVLSPVIVFDIINPNILNLNLNFGQLGGTASTGVGTSNGSPTSASSSALPVGTTVDQVNGTCPAGSTAVGGTTSCIVTSSTQTSPGAGSGNGTVAQNGSCKTGADCQGELVCDVLSNTCQPAGSGTYTCDDDSTPNPTTGLCADGTTAGNN